MNFDDRTYPAIVRDMLTALTGGTVGESHAIGPAVPDVIHLDERPVRRISHLEGQVRHGEDLQPYRFTERDFELVGSDEDPDAKVAIRFRERGRRPAPGTMLTVNYYPERLRPTPITDVNVGSAARTLLETVAREMATQYRQLQRVYESGFVETASGGSLEKVAALVGVRRITQGHAVGKVRFSRRSGSAGSVFIPIDTVVSDGDGNRYLTSTEGTLLPNQSSVEIWVHGRTPNVKPVEAAKLTILERAIAGIDRVVNDDATYRASEAEDDDQLRGRTRRAIHATGKGTRDAIRFGLESLPFVRGVTLAEYPDTPMPGMLRVDVALAEDDPAKRRLVDDRIESLRPAGIHIERNWAAGVSLGLEVMLTLAGVPQPVSIIEDVKRGVGERLAKHVRGLAPGGTLRRARLVSLVLSDDRVADARITITADGGEVTGDQWSLPTGQAANLDPVDPVAFAPIVFEDEGRDLDAAVVRVEAELAVEGLSTDASALEGRIRTVLSTFLGNLGPGDRIGFDALATAIRDDERYALVRGDSVFAFDVEGGTFIELREGGAEWAAPPGATIEVRAVRVMEVAR